ncbi:DExH-box ATP-dependent RNA helicase DExH1 [Lucilia sericata]|uniref:DExH-box ATP-dependent RNA helicase DExH1 n=1 Tax=Lucilia sericata TaxID=13632 RepID=UPI0018A7FD7B|nr:DExH-box ATP-dependent RNA helicase DExH1 [Lucilia sericata]
MSTNTKKHRQKAAGIDGGGSSRNQRESHKMPESERLPLQLKISDFLAGSEDEIVFKGLSNIQRKYMHQFAARLGLKTQSYGSKNNRELHVRRRKRLTTLGDVRPLNMSAATRAVLQSLLPTIQTQLVTNQVIVQSNPNASHRYRNLRSDSISVALGPRMIPPRAQRISNELFRDKQELPIYHYQGELHQMLKQHNVFIINGETGSGKTTQVPQYILNEATRRNRPCRIVVTQPRRVAAVSVAHRVAKERGEPLGETVGYQIRMESRVKKTSNLIYTTSGCFLRSIMADVRDLFRKVSHVIIDEIHERDKNTDFTLITIKEQLKLNKDLKVILMSATMDIQLLSNYFDNCPVLNVPGQGYDVKIYHLEDILFHTGYRTALMEKYLRSMQEAFPTPTSMFSDNILETMMNHTTADRLEDEYMQQVLDSLIEQCCESVEIRSKEELNEMFDQIQYYIESEGMSINAGHSETGLTPLMAACKCNMPEFVQFLILRQANVGIRDHDGYEAIDYARLHADGLCLQILMGSTNCVERVKQQEELSQQDKEKHRILAAYQQQFNDDNEVDHDLILSLLEGLYRNGHSGAIMVFLPGYNDIVQQRDLIQSTLPAGTYKLCILHGHMDSKDQFEALQRHPVRKIILSTNIGQTSITIPDLAYIIDSGKVKMNTYDSITESSQLQAIWISQADACQRSGRAGRTQNGVCYRLYSKAKYQFMPQFSIPEFMRIPLTEICLYAKTLEPKCGVQTYLQKSLNPPSTLSIQNAVRKLKILGVFRDDESVTELGKHLVDIPLDVQLGKCLLYGVFLKCYDPILTICAYHSVKDPFILPTDRSAQGQASFQRKSFSGQSFSDQMGILSLHKSYMEVRHNPRKVREFCNKYFLSHSAMEMFCATRKQINDVIKNMFNINYMDKMFNNDWHMIQLCLVAGFYPNVALIDRKALKLVCGAEKQLLLQRTSSLNPPGKKHLKEFINQLPHDWIVFYEKSRITNTCTINMNTVVPSLMIALQCGLDCDIINNVGNEEDDTDEEELECNDDIDTDSDSQHSLQLTSNTATNTTNSHSSTSNSSNILNDFEALQQKLSKTLKNISLNNDNCKTIMSLDNWIKFDLQSGDAKLLLLMRIALHTQFLAFLKTGPNAATSSAAFCIQKLLNTLHSSHAATFKMTV